MKNHPALFALIALLYLALACYQLDLPGLHYDEAFEVVPMVQLWQGQSVTSFRESGLTLGGQIWPIMTQDYIGALNSYATLPALILFGPTPFALRIVAVGVGLLTLWLAYQLTTYLTDSHGVGLLAALLLAVDPTIIFWNRQGVFVTAITAPIGLGAAYCWLKWLDQGRLGWAVGGAFLFGLGVYAKFLFVWLIAALGLGLIVLHGADLWQRVGEVGRSAQFWGGTALGFLAGCWPLLLYNWQTQGTYLAITQNAGQSYYGVNNLDVFTNLGTRIGQFGTLLDGGHLWYLGQVQNNPYPVGLFISVVVLTMILGARCWRSPEYRRILLPLLVIVVVIGVSVGTVSALWITHYAVLMAWPTIALVVGGWFLSREIPLSQFTRQAVAGIAVTVLLLTNLFSTLNYHLALAESGGLSTHSDAIYDLADWLEERAGRPVAAMDWGLAAPLIYLSNGQISVTELFGYAWNEDSDLTVRFSQYVADPQTFYLWRAPDEVIFDRSGPFKEFYRPRSLQENIEDAFYERSGRPLLGVTSLMPEGTAPNPP